MSEKPSRKKRVDSPEPTAVIRELMAQPGIKKIRVFKNGDQYHHGVQVGERGRCPWRTSRWCTGHVGGRSGGGRAVVVAGLRWLRWIG